MIRLASLAASAIVALATAQGDDEVRRIDGYRGIWFTLGQFSEHGDKYSGGLGTYTANHQPLAVYSPEAEKTFFVYGGTASEDTRNLLAMVSYYDHRTHQVPRPVVVMDKSPVDDPHDNPSINISPDGHLWIFVSGRGRNRPGTIFRSLQPYSIEGFEKIAEQEFTYPQVWITPDGGFFLLFTKYTAGRELYWKTSPDGRTWSEDHKLAGIGGHYQTSTAEAGKVATFFNYHPGGNVDRRTNLYYLESSDWGTTWTTADGTPVTVPLTDIENPALVRPLESDGRMMYTCDVRLDADGRPILLYVTSAGYQPGPSSDPRHLESSRWTGTAWHHARVAPATHNYDMGSLFPTHSPIPGWKIIAPVGTGPQPLGTGGEMLVFHSADDGKSWKPAPALTSGSTRNHAYARRPHLARDPFHVFWADGDPSKMSRSQLYFACSEGIVRTLPYDMPEDSHSFR
jgi:hypothetical protein